MRVPIAVAALGLMLAGCGGSSPTAVIDAPSMPVVSVTSTETRPGYVRVDWLVADDRGLDFEVQRRNAERPWKFIAALAPDTDGRMTLEDTGVAPGQPYTYRVRVLGGDPAEFGGLVEVLAAGAPAPGR